MRKIDSLVRDALRNFEPDIRAKRNRAVEFWKSIAGVELSRLARPIGFRGSVLILSTLHPAAAMELRLRKGEILDRLNSIWDQEIFTDIRTVTRKNGR
jgi:hypothetical protein